MHLKKRISLFLALAVAVAAANGEATGACEDYCLPGARCWPTHQEMLHLNSSTKGRVYTSFDSEYNNLVIMINTRVSKLPYFIVIVESVDDVITAVKFARKHNIKITIRSSGHDFIGRATWDGSLQINLSKLRDFKFNLNSSRSRAGEVSAQAGNAWLRLYEEASKRGRVVVGGSSHTVTVGGYTLGGGHSPIGREFGLAVDNLLDVEMVSANGSLIRADKYGTTVVDSETGRLFHSRNADIFWAVRGGGGSTFGIVTTMTFKLHFDSKMVMVVCSTPILDEQGQNIGRNFMESFNRILTTSLASEWGGYELISVNAGETQGNVILFLNHYGEWGSRSFNTISPLLAMMSQHCLFYNVSNFLEYAIHANDSLYYRTYIFNTLLQRDSFTPNFYNYLFGMVTDPSRKSLLYCTGVLVGGNMIYVNFDTTSVNPNLRTAVVSMTCALSWDDPNRDEEMISHAENVTKGFLQFGKGTFFNEPSVYQPDWKTAYWSGHYPRLLTIKREWDPDNIFTCHHCVGSDLPNGANFYENRAGSNIPPIVG